MAPSDPARDQRTGRGGSPASEPGPYRRPCGLGAAIGAILVARAVRRRFEPRLETIQITYPDGRGPSSQPASACSKRAASPRSHTPRCVAAGACSTCRVRIVQGGAFTHQPVWKSAVSLSGSGRRPTCAWPVSCVHAQCGSDPALAGQRPGECWLCHAWTPCRAGAGDYRVVR